MGNLSQADTPSGEERKVKRQRAKAVFSLANVRLFVAFRAVFNARFYYPVFTILFLDYGLTLEQFALLNTVWAFTIVLTEVPSGALADIIGRKQLLVATSLLMIVEMSLIAFVPLGNPQAVFVAFLVNRVLSGLAEALASGADEALAYDTLVEHGLATEWPRVIELQMRAQNVGYIVAMTLGAAVYDSHLLNSLFASLGWPLRLDQQVSMRFPVYLTLLFALLAFAITLRMRDPAAGRPQSETAGRRSFTATLWEVSRLTIGAGGWIVRTPFALAVILFAMTFDHTLRMLVTLTSEYYRLINLPDASFGLLGSLVAVIGLFVPRVARVMVERYPPWLNMLILAGGSVLVLGLVALFLPYFGLLPMMAVFIGLMLTGFFTSHYLNAVTDSRQRATVLSFKGLAFNAAYGFIGLVFAAFVRHTHARLAAAHADWPDSTVADAAFQSVIGYFPWYLAISLMAVAGLCVPRLFRQQRAAKALE